MSSLEADNFRLAPKAYSKEFEYILTGIVKCYKLILKNKTPISNNENKIRDIILKNYLNNNSIRKQVGLADYLFDGEPIEGQGFVDIKISTQNTFSDTSAYYIIECKILDNKNLKGTSGLNAKYIKNGIMRFISEKYSAYYGLNGMIGFVVEQMDIANNIENINNLLDNEFSNANTIEKLKTVNFVENFAYSYRSTHRNNSKKRVQLYHLMFDFSKNLKQQKNQRGKTKASSAHKPT